MTSSLILARTSAFFKPLLIAVSFFLLLRGHNEPGGGFVGGLLAASAFVLQAISRGVPSARASLRVDPHVFLGAGLMTALASGLPAFLKGQPFLTGQWLRLQLPLAGTLELSTVLVFDVGVYLVVIGTVLLIVFTLAEE